MAYYILNSAVITTPGNYIYLHININEARRWLKENPWESTLGYEETAKALEMLVGIKIPVNRKLIKMKPGDEALVFRLTRRLDDPAIKGSVGIDFIIENCEIGILKRLK
ncbi:MAG: DUF1874 domain-containing protein [Calditrichaeota bacterium]|nr:DUF1874 domain-containing protein [Calditrichota bacterium]